jgi:hypothetical protein
MDSGMAGADGSEFDKIPFVTGRRSVRIASRYRKRCVRCDRAGHMLTSRAA